MNFLKRYKSVLTPDQRKERKKLLILSLLSGLLIGISFPPIPLPYLMFGALIPYFIVIDSKKTLGEINRFTYAFAFVFTIISIYWVGSWTSEADPFLMISGAMLMFYNPLMLLIPSTLFYFTKKKFGDKIPFLLFPFFWAVETWIVWRLTTLCIFIVCLNFVFRGLRWDTVKRTLNRLFKSRILSVRTDFQ